MTRLVGLLLVLVAFGCRTASVSEAPSERAVGLADVERLLRITPDLRAAREAQLSDALAAHASDPSEANAIWVGRRLAYLGMHEHAVVWFEEQLGLWPDSFRLRRHLGHRWITLREFERARAVLDEARALAADVPDEIEPDGQPNARGIPTSTLQGNIDYHRALAAYLLGDFDAAIEAWRACVETWATNDDSRVAAGHWLLLTLRRAGREAEFASVVAALPAAPDVIENHAYRELVDLHAGRVSAVSLLGLAADPVHDATRTFGVARWYLDHPGATDEDRARGAALLRLVAEQAPWESFARVAAEVDRQRTER
jgi:tetratricopeptide (TPR) repeat protein